MAGLASRSKTARTRSGARGWRCKARRRLCCRGSSRASGELRCFMWKAANGCKWLRKGKVATPSEAGEIQIFSSVPTRMQVKRAALGADGLVVDHYNARALEHYLAAVGDKLVDSVPRGGIRSIFCDSFEVYRTNWTDAFPDVFRRKRGYDLIPHLPALFDDAHPDARDLRCDFWRTLSDLALEEFVEPLQRWAHRKGVTTQVEVVWHAAGIAGQLSRGGCADGRALRVEGIQLVTLGELGRTSGGQANDTRRGVDLAGAAESFRGFAGGFEALLRSAFFVRHQCALRRHVCVFADGAGLAGMGALLRTGGESYVTLLALFRISRGLCESRDVRAAAGETCGGCRGIPGRGRCDGGGGHGAIAAELGSAGPDQQQRAAAGIQLEERAAV